jgi:sterol desaturase/sphingolipid hydroxylase (fatty acid hydroxylase superfamily)
MNLVERAIPFFLALLLLEVAVAAFRHRRVFEVRDTFASLAMGVGSVIIGLGWAGAQLAVFGALHRHALFELGTGPWMLAAALLADDFAYYWFHRLHHEVRVFWAAHVTHHSSQRYNLATALRQSWTPMTTLPFWAPLAWLGFDPLLLVTAHGLNLLYQFWIHTELIGRLGPLEWVLNTPSHHRVHHGANVQYLDRNYGGILIVWDRLFGTFQPEGEPVRFGLTKDIGTYNPLRIAFHEWVAVIAAALRPNPLPVRLAYLLAPPGWSPDSSTLTAAQTQARAAEARPALERGEAAAA